MPLESSATETEVESVSAVSDGPDKTPVVATPDAPETGTPETSSDSEKVSDAKAPKSPLEAVKASLAKTKADATSGVKPGTSPQSDDDESKDKSETDKVEPPPFNKHPRWKEVTQRNRELETTAAELTPKAQRWDAIDAKFRETGLGPEDVGPLFDGGAMLKRAGVSSEEVHNLMRVGAALKTGDRQLAIQIAREPFRQLGLDVVDFLPDDIRSKVDEGALSEEAAREYAQARTSANIEKARRERAEAGQLQGQNAAAWRQAQEQMASATGAWEQRVAKTDVDWRQKEAAILEEVELQIALRRPATAQAAIQICEDAHNKVTRQFKSFAGSGNRKPAVSSPSGGSSPTTAIVPKSPLEAAKLALRG